VNASKNARKLYKQKNPNLLHKKIHIVNFFVQKKKSTMLPQAMLPCTG
jgi:hypothetical protein